MQNSYADSRSIAESLRGGPDGLRPVVSKDVQPVLECLDTSRDVILISLAVITAAVSKVGGARRIPDTRVSGIDTDRVCVLENDVCTIDVRRKVVVLRSCFYHRHPSKYAK